MYLLFLFIDNPVKSALKSDLEIHPSLYVKDNITD